VKLVGYIRVSSTGQVEDGQGLDIQEQAIRSWCRSHRHRLVAVHQDAGISGTSGEREGLTEALSALRFGDAKGIVVSSLDRLARSMTVQEAALQQAWSAGGVVFTVEGVEILADDPDDPVRTFVRQVLGAVSQLEAGMIARRLRRGRLHKVAQGGYGHGAPPFGYRAEGGELVVDQDEQAVRTRIASLRRQGASLRHIADLLNEEGVTSKRGGRWHPQTVDRAWVDRRPSESRPQK